VNGYDGRASALPEVAVSRKEGKAAHITPVSLFEVDAAQYGERDSA
jgi:hypothetical protein